MTKLSTRLFITASLGVVLFAGTGLAAEPADVEKFVNARIEIGEMMTNYFKGGESYGAGQRPSPEKRAEPNIAPIASSTASAWNISPIC